MQVSSQKQIRMELTHKDVVKILKNYLKTIGFSDVPEEDIITVRPSKDNPYKLEGLTIFWEQEEQTEEREI